MKLRPLGIASGAALVLVGCGVASNAGLHAVPVVDALGREAPLPVAVFAAAYPAPLLDVSASSTRNAYFPVTQVRDYRFNSAWAPAPDDAAPELTFQLSREVDLSLLGIKLSLGRYSSPDQRRVLVDVAVSSDGGTSWSTVATGLNPPETVFSTFPFDTVSGDAVRLRFRPAGADDLSELLVCEANVVDPVAPPGGPDASPTPGSDASASPTPDASATSTPSPTPTPLGAASSTPSTAPVGNTSCHLMHGSGWADANGSRIEFGFLVQSRTSDFYAWPVVIEDRGARASYTGTVTEATVAHPNVTLSGTLSGGGTFRLTAFDGGEQNSADQVAIWINGAPLVNGALGRGGGGGIQAHVRDCDDTTLPGVGR